MTKEKCVGPEQGGESSQSQGSMKLRCTETMSSEDLKDSASGDANAQNQNESSTSSKIVDSDFETQRIESQEDDDLVSQKGGVLPEAEDPDATLFEESAHEKPSVGTEEIEVTQEVTQAERPTGSENDSDDIMTTQEVTPEKKYHRYDKFARARDDSEDIETTCEVTLDDSVHSTHVDGLSDSDTDFSGDEEISKQESNGRNGVGIPDSALTVEEAGQTTSKSEEHCMDVVSLPTLSLSDKSSACSSDVITKRNQEPKNGSIKKFTDIDDTQEVQTSQDIFASQGSAVSSQGDVDVTTPSQLIPTLQFSQLSGSSGITPSFDSFLPGPLMPNTPTEDKKNPSKATSTPYKRKSNASSPPVAKRLCTDEKVPEHKVNTDSMPDEVTETPEKEQEHLDSAAAAVSSHGEKRKKSEEGSSSDSSVKVSTSKKICLEEKESRMSIMVLEEKSTAAPKPFNVKDDEEQGVDSQAIHLYYTSSQSDQDSQETASTNSTTESSSWKSHMGSHPVSSNEMKESSICDTASKDRDYSSSQIVHIDDDDVDVEVINETGEVSTLSIEEITIDSSGHKDRMSTSVEGVEVLATSSPALKGTPLTRNTVRHVTPGTSPISVLPPLRPRSDNLGITTVLNQHSKAKASRAMPPPENPLSASLPAQSFENAKENIHPGKIVHHILNEEEFDLQFSVPLKVKIREMVDPETKKPVLCSITSCEIAESFLHEKDQGRGDSSHGDFGDASSPGPSHGSPGSVVSGRGMYTLPETTHKQRMSMISTTSSSSAGSSASSLMYRTQFGGRNQVGTFCGISSNVPQQEVSGSTWSQAVTQLDVSLLVQHYRQQLIEHFEHMTSQPSINVAESKELQKKKLETLNEEVDNNEDVLGVPTTPLKNVPIKKGRQKRTVSETEPMKESKTPRSTRKRGSKNEVKGESAELNSEASNGVTPASEQVKRGRRGVSRTPTPSFQSDLAQESNSLVPQTSSATKTSFSYSEISGSSFYQPGAQVFAAWEKSYYPAELERQVKPHYWQVVFHDMQRKSLNEKFILLINTFVIGQPVYAKTEDCPDYRSGIVTAVTPLEGKEDLYTIELTTGGSVTVSRTDLCLNEEQALLCLDDRPKSACSIALSPQKRTPKSIKGSSIDLGNLVQGKRVRTPKSSMNSPSSAGTSGTARRLITDSSSASEDDTLATALVPGVQPEQQGFSTADPLARKGKGVKGSSAKHLLPDIEDEEIVQKYGPLPPEGSKIFAGKNFVITVTEVKPKHREDVRTDDSDIETEDDGAPRNAGSDSECFEFTSLPISKDRLTRQIQCGGGKVYKSLRDVPSKDIKNTLVVSDRPCLTASYIRALALSVQSVSHEHIITCCKDNKKVSRDLNRQLLPAGFSLQRREFVTWDERLSKSPLRGQLLIVLGDKNFKQFWEDILKLAGATIVPLKSMKDMNDVTTVLSDKPCPSSDILSHALELAIPVVSPIWIIQCLINSKVLAHSAHVSYSYDYSEPE